MPVRPGFLVTLERAGSGEGGAELLLLASSRRILESLAPGIYGFEDRALGRILSTLDPGESGRAVKALWPHPLVRGIARCGGFRELWGEQLAQHWGALRLYVLRALELFPASLVGMHPPPRLHELMGELALRMLGAALALARQAAAETRGFSTCGEVEAILLEAASSLERRLRKTGGFPNGAHGS
jgi:hypothetical protein